jgi:hypothetical protein
VAYLLDSVPAGAWFGLSEVTAVTTAHCWRLECDNQRGAAAKANKVYRVDISKTKPLVARLLPRTLPALNAGGDAPNGKPGNLAVVGDGFFRRVLGVVDNDSVEDVPGGIRVHEARLALTIGENLRESGIPADSLSARARLTSGSVNSVLPSGVQA